MRLNPSDVIVRELLEPASASCRQHFASNGEISGKVFFEYATFCTIQMEDQHTLADTKRMEALHRNKQDEASRYNEAIKYAEQRNDKNTARKMTRDLDKALKLQKMDKTELQRLYTLQQTLLLKAIENFLRCFAACSDFDHYVPKFCAIWLKNSKQKNLYQVIAKELPAVPCYKFLPLMHQLCSRLSNERGDFQESLEKLILRILNDHPFHAVHQVFSTIASDGDEAASNRSRAAKALVDRMSHNPKIGTASVHDISSKLHEQFSAYSDLASLPVERNTQGGTDIPLNSYQSLRRFRQQGLPSLLLPPPSMKIPVSPDCQYATIPYVHKYNTTFRIAGGVNQPKILDCVLSNGNTFRELVNFFVAIVTTRSKVEMMTFIKMR